MCICLQKWPQNWWSGEWQIQWNNMPVKPPLPVRWFLAKDCVPQIRQPPYLPHMALWYFYVLSDILWCRNNIKQCIRAAVCHPKTKSVRCFQHCRTSICVLKEPTLKEINLPSLYMQYPGLHRLIPFFILIWGDASWNKRRQSSHLLQSY